MIIFKNVTLSYFFRIFVRKYNNLIIFYWMKKYTIISVIKKKVFVLLKTKTKWTEIPGSGRALLLLI